MLQQNSAVGWVTSLLMVWLATEMRTFRNYLQVQYNPLQIHVHLDFEREMIEEKKPQEEEGKRGAWNKVETEMKCLGVASATLVRPQTSKKRRATNRMLDSTTQMMMDTYLMQRKLSATCLMNFMERDLTKKSGETNEEN
ncbi:uncharacterized protein LOC111873583 [Cryptotermes secundus]|uniref:uncharacterized protein LOC111873583 n=1 Tax=Cryptotermes secundus TaxID=105785 RepID=UPI000CD7ADC0|nr:uncharacterized protein LOC111873583 [Cryptotermes secundus]XP_023724176.1 uncharacterized protein LOC111873583 [Cryptotermes secundus]XP_023724177.1 uncharacterized protein LOC111873583 [Cryptotermes secundus]